MKAVVAGIGLMAYPSASVAQQKEYDIEIELGRTMAWRRDTNGILVPAGERTTFRSRERPVSSLQSPNIVRLIQFPEFAVDRILIPQVVDDLHLSELQVTQLTELQDEIHGLSKRLLQSASSDVSGTTAPKVENPLDNFVNHVQRAEYIAKMRKQIAAKSEDKIKLLVSEWQFKRFNQLELQMKLLFKGLPALTSHDVANPLKLTDVQRTEIGDKSQEMLLRYSIEARKLYQKMMEERLESCLTDAQRELFIQRRGTPSENLVLHPAPLKN
jgi:hypothetical protein